MSPLVHGGDVYSLNRQDILDFSININPLGMPKGVKKAIVDNMELYSRYPDPLCRELRAALTEAFSVPMEKIVCGNGAADLIFRICLGIRPKKGLIVTPTFSEYEKALRQCGSQILYHELCESEGFSLSERILGDIDEGLDILFICNPNNPTGIPISINLMKKIAERCRKTGTYLVVDECFAEFLKNPELCSLLSQLHSFENLIILKAFTKIYAMAGIRLGYALCGSAKLAKGIMDTLQPWSVSTVAAKCGVAALSEKEYLLRTAEIVEKGRLFLTEGLQNPGFKVFPSMANFLFFKSEDTALEEKLKKSGILIRSCGNFHGLNPHFYRVSVKKQEENEILLQAFKREAEK